MKKLSTNLAPVNKLALETGNVQDPQVRLALQQLLQHVNKISSAVSTTGKSSSGGSLSAIEAELAELAAEIAALLGAKTYTAAAVISAYQAVYMPTLGAIAPADDTVPATGIGIVGITLAGGAVGAQIKVAQTGDTVTNPTWAFTPGPVYVGAAGQLTQTPAGYIALIGYAISPTSVLVLVTPLEETTTSSSYPPTTMQADFVIGDHQQCPMHEEIVLSVDQEIKLGTDTVLYGVA